MNPLLALLEDKLNDDNLIQQLTQQIGASNPEQTKTAATGITTALVSALAKNAAKPEGGSALAAALDRDHDGSILDDVMGMLSGQAQPANQNALNGAGIINHVLGNNQGGVIDMISKMSGLDKGKAGNLMITLAPLIMGALGKTKKQSGLDIGGLLGMLQGGVTQQRSSGNPTMDMITRFLDQDGDGNLNKEAMNIGKSLLGRLFGRK